MKTLLCLFGLLLVSAVRVVANENEVAAADDRRAAALVSGDAAQLEAILSDELRYTHSNANVDTKRTLIDALVTKRLDYEVLEKLERKISLPAPELALVWGQTRVVAKAGDRPVRMLLSSLAVYRREAGAWRLLTWQSTRLPD